MRFLSKRYLLGPPYSTATSMKKRMIPFIGWTLALLLLPVTAAAQSEEFTVATYNVRNLFDTLNEPGIHDMVLSPDEYQAKIEALATVIGALRPDVLALCEVENATVLRDLLAASPLDTVPLRYVHYDSPDPRGIDVALLYRTDRLRAVASEPIAAPERYSTRDILRVELQSLRSHRQAVVYAVHLPSKRGGTSRAARMRELLATQLAALIRQEPPEKRVVLMGDMNDTPGSRLFRRYWSELTCLTQAPHRRGLGSYAWRDAWLMYDNILVRPPLENASEARIFLRKEMLTEEGRFQGYPRREVSDHLPVYVRLCF